MQTFCHHDWQTYQMDYAHPHGALETAAQEIAVVDDALDALVAAGILPHRQYDYAKMLAHRLAVAELFEIPWTAITPRIQRLLYAINAIAQPRVLLAAGVFCGNTFISNAGAAVGPGACYTAEQLIGVEIEPAEAARAERNVRRIDATGVARILAADAIEAVRHYPRIDLLYIDANGSSRGKSIYLDILEAAFASLPAGSIVLAHNSVNAAQELTDYLAFVRDPAHCRASLNVIIDGEGLEVTRK